MWNYFILYAVIAAVLWTIGATASYKKAKPWLVYSSTVLGLTVFLLYIILMWKELGRPPMRTMGETRLWYSFFLPLAGLITYSRWDYKWLLSFSTLLSLVFICVNI